MAFEQRLVQTQTQKLILSPQIKQYIQLLQLPLIELQQSVEQELTENPALEEAPGTETDLKVEAAPESEAKTEELNFQETFDKLDKLDDELKTTLYSNQSSRLESIDELQKNHDYKESLINKSPTLSDHILWQLQFFDLSETDKQIATYLVHNIDDNGYLTTTVDEVTTHVGAQPADVERILDIIHHLDPPGIGARSLQECLCIQLANTDYGPETFFARQVVQSHFKLLEKKDIHQIAKVLSITEERAKKVCDLITSLEPKPGRYFAQDEATAIIPDASVYPSDEPGEGYIIDIHDDRIPQLRINKHYRAMLKDKKLDSKTREYLKSKINAAFWFIKAIEQRKSTLREITELIVKAQPDFFERGFAFLHPLRLKDIAAQIGIHESTVSRAISQKYVNTPQGTIPYKMFFSHKMEMEDGSLESQKSVMEKMKFIVDNEDPKKPLSDAKLVTLLKARGIKIARRTVAKYRDMLKILPSHLRKQK